MECLLALIGREIQGCEYVELKALGLNTYTLKHPPENS